MPGAAPMGSTYYELRVAGHLDRRWASRFEGLSLTHEPDGTTVLRGRVRDQAALHGLLDGVRDIGATLLSVEAPDHPQPRKDS